MPFKQVTPVHLSLYALLDCNVQGGARKVTKEVGNVLPACTWGSQPAHNFADHLLRRTHACGSEDLADQTIRCARLRHVDFVAWTLTATFAAADSRAEFGEFS